ncbi:MAG: hypothetical protein C0469_00620 [Cyanobacteria bacterium DS2.3.42]|nr:hypothetical protein [Cyanobacteria bacterium DS2.3.42]
MRQRDIDEAIEFDLSQVQEQETAHQLRLIVIEEAIAIDLVLRAAEEATPHALRQRAIEEALAHDEKLLAEEVPDAHALRMRAIEEFIANDKKLSAEEPASAHALRMRAIADATASDLVLLADEEGIAPNFVLVVDGKARAQDDLLRHIEENFQASAPVPEKYVFAKPEGKKSVSPKQSPQHACLAQRTALAYWGSPAPQNPTDQTGSANRFDTTVQMPAREKRLQPFEPGLEVASLNAANNSRKILHSYVEKQAAG